MIGFGLDPAGYGTGRSVLAVAERRGREAHVFLLRGCPFSKRPEKDRKIIDIWTAERVELKRIIRLGCIAIDVPIDLQGLPKIEGPTYLWQLTKRAVDHAVEGSAPLASFLGHVTARFQAILSDIELHNEIGRKIFETYPKPTLKRLLNDRWKVVEKYKNNADHRVRICELLGIEPATRIENDDDLDAVICAITAVATQEEVRNQDEYDLVQSTKLPDGYRLLDRIPFERIEVFSTQYDKWMKEYSSPA